MNTAKSRSSSTAAIARVRTAGPQRPREPLRRSGSPRRAHSTPRMSEFSNPTEPRRTPRARCGFRAGRGWRRRARRSRRGRWATRRPVGRAPPGGRLRPGPTPMSRAAVCGPPDVRRRKLRAWWSWPRAADSPRALRPGARHRAHRWPALTTRWRPGPGVKSVRSRPRRWIRSGASSGRVLPMGRSTHRTARAPRRSSATALVRRLCLLRRVRRTRIPLPHRSGCSTREPDDREDSSAYAVRGSVAVIQGRT